MTIKRLPLKDRCDCLQLHSSDSTRQNLIRKCTDINSSNPSAKSAAATRLVPYSLVGDGDVTYVERRTLSDKGTIVSEL